MSHAIKGRCDADYEILKKNNYKWMFLDHHSKGKPGYISYGQFIVHAIWSGLHGKHPEVGFVDENRLLAILKDLQDFFEGKITNSNSIDDCEIIQVFNCTDLHGASKGIMIKDKTYGCYPLYIKDYRGREWGLKNHLNEIIKNWPRILELLKQYNEEWNPELEQKLDDYYFK